MVQKNLQQIQLKTTRLILKPFKPGDGNAIYDAVMETYDTLELWDIWILNTKEKLTPNDYELFGMKKLQLLRENKDLTLLIFEQFSGKLIGSVSINQIDRENSYGSLGFWLRKSHMKKGYAQEAATCLIDFAFAHMGLSKIKAVHEYGNKKSEQTLLRLGFKIDESINTNISTSSNWVRYVKNNLRKNY